MARTCITVTVSAAGTPVNLATNATSANPKGSAPIWVKKLRVQALVGSSTAYGYLLTAPQGTTPAHGTSGQLLEQIAPATTTVPGIPTQELEDSGTDLNTLWVDASHSGDTFVASWEY